MKCKDCKHYEKSEKFAGGRCKFLPKIASFPDSHCRAKKVIAIDEERHEQYGPLFEPKDKPKPKPKPDESALGDDPQNIYA